MSARIANELGIILVRAAAHGCDVLYALFCMEDCDMETVKDPIVLQLELEYKFLKVALEKENNKFELIRKQHARTVSQLADDITRKFFEYQAAKIEAKRYLEEQYKNYQENANE